MTDRRVVVLGASGFVGSAVCDRATAQGLDVARLSSTDVNLMSSGASSILASLLRDGDTICLLYTSPSCTRRPSPQPAALARSRPTC